MIRILCFLAECGNSIPIQHLSQCIVIPYFNFLLFVTGSESIKEVKHRKAGLNCRQMRNCCQIHYFLRAVGRQHSKTGLSGGHHVRVISKNRQGLRGDGSCRYVENARQPFRRNLIHVRNHQKQTLRCGISRRQRSGNQRTVNGTGSAALRLHFDNLYFLVKQILSTLICPSIYIFGHY